MTILVAWMWQGMLLAAATMAALRWATRLNAATRHLVYWAALSAVLLLPVASWLTTIIPTAPGVTLWSGSIGQLDGRAAPLQVSLPDWILAIIVGAWLGTLVVGLLRLGLALRALVGLRAGSLPLPEHRQRQLTLWSDARWSGRRAELRVSSHLRGACAIGLGRPVIVVADTVVDGLTDDELDQVVMHEHAHLTRYDDWSSLLQALIGSIAGVHPAVRWLGTQIDLEREAACDDHVVERTGEVRPYATCLATVADMARLDRQPDPALALSATRARSTLHRRVLRLLDRRRRRGRHFEWRTALCTVGLLGLAVYAASQATPLVVFLEAHARIDATDGATGAPLLTPDGPPAQADDLASAQPNGARRVAAPPTLRRRNPAAVLASRTHLAIAALHATPGVVDHSADSAEMIPAAGPARQARASVDARPTVGAALLLTAPAVEPQAVVTSVGGHDAGDVQSRGPWVATGQRAAAAGAGAKRAGISIATFFTRAGKALAQSF